jgi:hypothetical protein
MLARTDTDHHAHATCHRAFSSCRTVFVVVWVGKVAVCVHGRNAVRGCGHDRSFRCRNLYAWEECFGCGDRVLW